MSDFGRVDKNFPDHPKAKRARLADPGSISLWLFANCWCRKHRKEGFIPRANALELGTESEIKALVDSGLWLEVEGGYRFNDWAQWNSDLIRPAGARPSAIWIVSQCLSDHPDAVQQRLAVEVVKLIEEGVTTPVLESALRRWGSEPNARPTWLAYYASDAIRQGETGLLGAIKKARQTWDMAPMREFGFRWQAPDPPAGAKSVRQVREYMQKCKSDWLDQIEASIGKDGSP